MPSYHGGDLTAVGASQAFIQLPGYIVDLSATLEPDADGDGYGDLTQDLCPSQSASHLSCVPPETTITKKPTDPHAKVSKFKFTSSLAGSSFRCTLDGRKAHHCVSLAKYGCLKPGKHTFSVVAISPTAGADPTPAKVKFKVSAKRTGC